MVQDRSDQINQRQEDVKGFWSVENNRKADLYNKGVVAS